MSLPIPIFAFIPMSAAAFIHNRWAVKSEQKESETACGLAECSLVRVYCGRRSEDDGYGAIGVTGKLRGYGVTGTSVSDDTEGLKFRVPIG